MSDKKKILITGASTGFGLDTAKALAERGHTVYATMRGVEGKNKENAASLQGWAESGGHAVHVIELDVTSDESATAAAAKAEELGGVDVVINNAGFGVFSIDESYSVEQAQAIFDVNLFGVMRTNRAFLPAMRKAGKGLIIYVSSGLGRFVLPFMGIYNSSKYALEGYAETVSYEVGPLGIQSVIVQPGAFGTGFLGNTLQPAKDLTGEYGPTTETLVAFGGNFEAAAKAGQLPDPVAVVNALVEEVELDAADRPLRRPVGEDISEAVGAINETASAAQAKLLQTFGLG